MALISVYYRNHKYASCVHSYVYLGWADTKICAYNIATTQETSNELISHTYLYIRAYVAIPFLACHSFSFSSYFHPLLHIPLVVDV